LYNGNVEPPLRTVLTDPEHIFRLAWSSHEHKRDNVRRLHDRRPDLTIVRLRIRAEVNRWLAGLSRVPPG
jgi:hypothetical protein